MQVVKRDGNHEPVSFDKITKRISDLCFGLKNVDPLLIAKDTINGIFNGIKTTDLDILSAEICATKSHHHPEYNKLGGRILASNIVKTTSENYIDIVTLLFEKCIVSKQFYDFVSLNREQLQSMLNYQLDYLFDFFAIKTLERSYLFKIDGKIIERPQHMWMRVAIQIHGLIDQPDALERIKETYDLLSNLYFTHATPTLFNSGTSKPQLSSCYLFSCEDNLEDIFKMISDVAKISKWAGGIGLSLTNIRAKGSMIRGTNGKSEGIIPLCKTLEMVGRYINQGGKRNGSIATYLEPWHGDIYSFIELRKNTGDENLRARDLFIALWIPDLFMKRVQDNSDWTLMCPDACKGLVDSYGEEFEILYTQYESENKGIKTVKARDLWNHILENQIETGMPYISYKDTVNKRNMQKQLGVIRNSNLCNEIALFSNKENIAVCFTGDTQILTESGYKCIKDCNNEKVLSYFDTDTNMVHNEQFVTATLIDNGVKDVFELKCTGTNPIKVTENHLFAVYNRTIYKKGKVFKRLYEWKKVNELSKNDKILLPKINGLPNYISDSTNQVHEDYLTIGWMLGDGWQHVSKDNKRETYGVCFGPADAYARDRVIKKLNEMVDTSSFHKNGYNKRATDYYTDKRTGVYSWASSKKDFIKNIKEKYGLECKTAHYKIIPEKIKKSSPSEQASFLSGLFSADGSVYISSKSFYVNLSSSSETLLYDVKNMLKCFGIDSRIVYTSVKNNTNTQGKLTIENNESIMKYYKYINFTLSLAKSEKLKNGLETNNKKSNYRHYCSIKSLTYIGKENVYDLNVPNTHNFIAEGFVVHNCNLSSICLPRFIEDGVFNFEKLQYVAGVATRNLNNVIDVNFYPTPETQLTNFANRPIGIGIQGQADCYCMLGLPFGSDEARTLNRRIYENIYYGSVKASIQLAKEKGAYESYNDSPHSQGLLQFDFHENIELTLDWTELKKDMKTYGIRNSLLTALMPTASTSQIMTNNECFEPYTSNIYLRKTLAGEFTVVNQHLVKDLLKLGLWNKEVYEEILYDNGSVQNVKSIPEHIKQVYKTAFELKMTDMLKQAVERGPFIDHMQSMNLFMKKPDFNLLNSSHFYSWKNGLKTGMYYLRTQPAVDAVKFGLDPSSVLRIKADRKQTLEDAGVVEGVCPRDPYLRAICESCSS